MRDGVGHAGQKVVAHPLFQSASAHFCIKRDLDVDLVIRTVDARRIVDEVGVYTPAAQGKADSSCLRDAKVCAFTDNLGAHVRAVDAQRIIARVTNVEMAFSPILNIGADAAEPQELHGRFQDSRHQCSGFDFLCIDTEQQPDFRRSLDAFIATRKDAAAFRNQLWVIIEPA